MISIPSSIPVCFAAVDSSFSHGFWIQVVAGALLLAAGWTAARWWSRAAEAMQRTSRQMALAAELAHLGIWEWDIVNDRLRMTAKGYELFALPPATALTHAQFLERIHPEDRELIEERIQRALDRGSFHAICRLQMPDNAARWISASGLVEFDRAHKPIRMLCVCMDVSERRRAEETAWELSGKLIHAQEDERRRIARDLHDDLNQRLALLSVEMELLGRPTSAGRDEFDRRLEHAAEQVRALSSEVHKLSYGLHPAKLEQLGLVAAVRSFCREMTQQHGIKIHFSHGDVPRDIDSETALGLYRVMQESLRNAVRHSEAKEAKVHLQTTDGRLRMTISDHGNGFDVEKARRNSGLGLVSMEERVRLLRGMFKIKSEPGAGTEIAVEAPISTRPPASVAKQNAMASN
jgi:signal transduction histidine kinase